MPSAAAVLTVARSLSVYSRSIAIECSAPSLSLFERQPWPLLLILRTCVRVLSTAVRR
jgi:hypothetical protein